MPPVPLHRSHGSGSFRSPLNSAAPTAAVTAPPTMTSCARPGQLGGSGAGVGQGGGGGGARRQGATGGAVVRFAGVARTGRAGAALPVTAACPRTPHLQGRGVCARQGEQRVHGGGGLARPVAASAGVGGGAGERWRTAGAGAAACVGPASAGGAGCRQRAAGWLSAAGGGGGVGGRPQGAVLQRAGRHARVSGMHGHDCLQPRPAPRRAPVAAAGPTLRCHASARPNPGLSGIVRGQGAICSHKSLLCTHHDWLAGRRTVECVPLTV